MTSGIWFYGMSGSGKTFCSKIITKIKKKSIIVDGDFVRKNVSFDLGYSERDRKMQCLRMLGISKIIIKSGYYPIISTAYLSRETFKKLKKNNIKPILILRDKKKCIKFGKAYKKNKRNIVGIDIKQEKFKTNIIKNTNKNEIEKELRKII